MMPDEAILRFRAGPDECWVWPGNPREYPKVRLGSGQTQGAHRYVMLATRPSATKAMAATHSCDNKRCVNPNHISGGTRSRNTRDAYARGLIPRVKGAIAQRAAQTHCHRGHEFTPENTRRTSRGTRSCRRCHADRERKRRMTRRGEQS